MEGNETDADEAAGRPHLTAVSGRVDRLAYFFYELPQPLRLPDGFVVQGVIAPGIEDFRGAHEAGARADEMAALVPVTASSIRVWQTSLPADAVATYHLGAVMEVAHRAFPSVHAASDRAEGDVADGDAPMEDIPRTVVEVAVPYSSADADGVSDAFDIGLLAVQRLQRAHFAVTREPLTLVSQESLMPVIPFAVRDISSEPEEWPSEIQLFEINANVQQWVREPEFDDSELRAFEAALAHTAANPFIPALELLGEARSALEIRGDYRSALILLYSASEVLLDTVLMHLLWEEATRPEDATEYFDARGLRERVRRHFHSRVGGNWSLDGSGVPAQWELALATVRHRVVHAGYQPTRSEAYMALEAFKSLDRFLGDRLAESRSLGRYLRTALKYVGESGLAARSRASKRIRNLLTDPDEPDWAATFERWRWVVNDAREEASVTYDEDQQPVAVYLYEAGAPGQWHIHDRSRKRVCPSEPPQDLTDKAAATIKQQAEAFAQDAPLGTRMTGAWFGAAGRPLPGAEWQREHEVFPEHGVMVDGTDYT